MHLQFVLLFFVIKFRNMGHPLEKFRYCPECGSSGFHEHNATSKRCGDCGFTYYFNPRAAVVAVIVNEANELLVCRRAKDPCKGTLDLPGGFCESFETAEESVRREVKEETGLEVEKASYLFSLPNIYTYSSFDVHTMDLFFICMVKVYSEVSARDDVIECMFIPFRDINPEKFGLDSIRKGIGMILEERDRIFNI